MSRFLLLFWCRPHTVADSSTSSPKFHCLLTTTGCYTTQRTVAHHSIAPPVQDSNGQARWIFPPAAPGRPCFTLVQDTCRTSRQRAPEIIELLDDDTDEEAEDNGGKYDENGGRKW